MTSQQPGSLRTNSAYQLTSQGLLLALRILTSPYFFWGLGAEEYGILVLVGLSTSYFSFLELGLGEASVRLIAHHNSRGERREAALVFRTSTLSFGFLGLLAACLLAGSSSFVVEHVLALSPQATGPAAEAILIAAVGLFVSMQLSVSSSPARALERFDIVSRAALLSTLLQILAGVLALHLGLGLKGVLWGSISAQALALGAYWFINRRVLEIGVGGRWDGPVFRRLFRFGGPVAVSQVSLPLLVHSEKVIISSVTGVGSLPYYSVPNSLISGLWVVPSSLGSVTLPRLTHLAAQGEGAAARDVLYKTNRFAFAALIPSCLFLAIFAREVLDTWMGHDFGVLAAAPLQILCLAAVVNAAAWPTYQLLLATGHPGVLARIHVLELVVYLPVCYPPVVWGGIEGAALSWLLRVTGDTFLVTWSAEARLRVGPARAMIAAAGRPLAASAAMAVPLFYLSPDLGSAGRLEALAVLGGMLCFYLPAAGLLSLDSTERSTVLGMARTLRASGRRVEKGEPGREKP